MIRFMTVLFLMFLSFQAKAQPIIDIGQDTLRENKPKKEESSVLTEAKDSRGIFSFMNFNFGKKEKKIEVEDGESALEKLIRLADEGDVDSQLTLGYIYLYGDSNVPRDDEKAFYYYTLAAEQNDMVAVNNLGSLYYSGIGTDRSTVKAAQMFEKAVSLGNNEAAVNLAFIYLTGMGLPKNYGKAISLFQIAADNNSQVAKFMLGYSYYKGFGVKRDLRRAFALIKEAAESNYDDAQYVLAKMYMGGEGVAKNYGNAVKYLNAAARQGNLPAMLEIGTIYVDGVVYTQNIFDAHIWFNIASVYGDESAARKRDILEKKLKIEELLQAQTTAEKFVERPSEVTVYIRETFGDNIKSYIDEAISDVRKKRGK